MPKTKDPTRAFRSLPIGAQFIHTRQTPDLDRVCTKTGRNQYKGPSGTPCLKLDTLERVIPVTARTAAPKETHEG